MVRILSTAPVLLLMTLASGQGAKPDVSFPEMRKRYGVDRTYRLHEIPPFVGAKFLDLRAMVKGSFTSPGMAGLIVENTKSKSQLGISADAVPEWLVGVEREARFVVRAERNTPTSEPKFTLLAAAPVEAAPDLKPKVTTPPKKPAAKPSTKRAATRPAASRANPGRTWVLPASEVTPIYASFVKRQNPKLSNREATRIAQGVVGFSLKYGVDARLVISIVMVESGFDPFATSHAGAMGLGQLMPGTAQGLGVRRAYDSIENLYGMIKHLRRLLVMYQRQTGGDPQRTLALSLAAYNAGEGAVRKHGGIPPYRETQRYVRKVMEIYATLAGTR